MDVVEDALVLVVGSAWEGVDWVSSEVCANSRIKLPITSTRAIRIG